MAGRRRKEAEAVSAGAKPQGVAASRSAAAKRGDDAQAQTWAMLRHAVPMSRTALAAAAAARNRKSQGEHPWMIDIPPVLLDPLRSLPRVPTVEEVDQRFGARNRPAPAKSR